MVEEKKSKVWMTMLVISILFIIWVLFMMSGGDGILPKAFELAGSPQLTSDLEEKALAFMNMTMLKPLWEEIWIGIFGIFIAFGLKKKQKYAWTLGIFWGIMMIFNGLIQGGYELFILNWSKVCMQTYAFLLLGVIAIGSLYFKKTEFLE